jgi:hypothetical protein
LIDFNVLNFVIENYTATQIASLTLLSKRLWTLNPHNGTECNSYCPDANLLPKIIFELPSPDTESTVQA